MTSVSLNKIRGEFTRGGIRAVVASSLERPGRWMSAYLELRKNRTYDVSMHLLAYTRVLGRGWFNPCQVDAEICALLDRVRELSPKVLVEIGTATGGTLFMLTRVAAPDAELISIDLPGGSFGGGYPIWRAPLYRRFGLPGQHLHLLRGNSQDRKMVTALEGILRGRPVDFLFLDGDHSYQGVRQDHETFSPFVRSGGLVALHDIHPSTDPATEVPRYWREIRDAVSGIEWVASSEQNGFGIGAYEVEKV
jgi:predicted O-methyltransferase YrrM